MEDLFVDTAGWVCHFDASQPNHAEAVTHIGVSLAEGRRLLTTNYVITELVALLGSRRHLSRDKIIACVEAIKSWPPIEIIHVDERLDADAWRLLKSRRDKEWSLVDCASLVVMQERKLSEALTTDHHFAQAGFIPLLKHPT